MKDSLYIIANEDKLDVPVFFKTLKDGERYLKYIGEFSDTYSLGYAFKDGSDDNVAPIMLALDGNVVVKTSYDFVGMAVFYIPEVLTANQKKWLDDNLGNFKNYNYLGFNNYSVGDDNSIVEMQVEDLDKELVEIEKRFLRYKESGKNNNVLS